MLGDKWEQDLKAARSAKQFLLQFTSNFAVNHQPELAALGHSLCCLNVLKQCFSNVNVSLRERVVKSAIFQMLINHDLSHRPEVKETMCCPCCHRHNMSCVKEFLISLHTIQ